MRLIGKTGMGCKCLGCPKWGKEDSGRPDDSGTGLVEPRSKSARDNSANRSASSTVKLGGLVGISEIGQRGKELPEAKRVNSALAVSEKDTILRSIRPQLPFQHLPFPQLEWMAESMQRYSLSPGQLVFAEDLWGEGCYVLGTGKLKVERQGKQVAIMKPIATFGEDALMIEVKRSMTITAATEAIIWGMDKQVFRTYIQGSSSEAYNQRKALISQAAVFSLLSPLQKQDITQIATFVSFPADTIVITEGYRGEVCYILQSGTVNCIQSGSSLLQLSIGDYFGDQALLYGGKRTCTVVAVTEVNCVAVRREDLEVVLGGNLQSVLLANALKQALTKCKELGDLSEVQVEALMGKAEMSSWEQGDTLVQGGTAKGEGMWVVLAGQVREEGKEEVLAGGFACIGATDLIVRSQVPYSASLIIASGTADIAYFSHSAIALALQAPLPAALLQGQAYTALLQCPSLRLLPTPVLWQLVQSLRTQQYPDLSVLAQAQNSADFYFILQSGTVKLLGQGTVGRAGECLFGKEVVCEGKYEVSVQAEGPVVCWVGSREDLHEALGPGLVKWLQNRYNLPTSDFLISQLTVLTTLETAPLGPTLLVQNQAHKYVLKVVEKANIQTAEAKKKVLEEKKVREIADCIGIPQLIRTYKDDFRLYFLLEYLPNAPFSDIIQLFPLSPDQARFYISSLLLLLFSLHSRNILLRSLSFSSLFLDWQGYPCLFSLSSAKVVPERTYTQLGSPHYMAPEVILGTGYSGDADYWSLGVVAYQCVYGKLPFGEGIAQPIQIYDKVLNSKLKFPHNVDIGEAKSLIETLLSRNPPLRHHCNPAKLRRHPWLAGTDWVRAR